MSLHATIFYFMLPLMLSMVHFSVSASNGIGEGAVKRGTPMKAALIFALSTFILTWIGYYLASLLINRFDYKPESIAFVFFAITGFRMILHAWQKKSKQKNIRHQRNSGNFCSCACPGYEYAFYGNCCKVS